MSEQQVTNDNSVSSPKEDILTTTPKKPRGRPRKVNNGVTPALTKSVELTQIPVTTSVSFKQQDLSQEIVKDIVHIEQDMVKLAKDTKFYIKSKAPLINIISIFFGLMFILGFYLYSLNKEQNLVSTQEVSVSTPVTVAEVSNEGVAPLVPVTPIIEPSPQLSASVVDNTPIALKQTKKLEDSISFANGASRLGPIGRAKAEEVYSVMKDNIDYDLFLYGYAGPLKNKDHQKSLAKARAISVKIYMVNDLGANPKDIKVVEPKYYLFKEGLPENDKQVKTVFKQK